MHTSNSNMLERVQELIVTSGWLLPVYAVLALALYLAGLLAVADYEASVAGYRLLPTEEITPGIEVAFGLLPQVGQIVFGFFTAAAILANSEHAKFYGLLTIGIFIVDAGTDFVALVGDNTGWVVYLVALLQAVLVYTLLSEWLLLSTVTLLFRLTPNMLEEVATLINRIMGSFNKALAMLKDEKPENQRNRKS